MVREGKWAEVTHCRQGMTSTPVNGHTRKPVSGRVHDGEAHARTVSQAKVAKAELNRREMPAAVKQLSINPSCTKQVQAVHTIPGREKDIHPKAVDYRDADREMTLKTLFHLL